ncbi:MAG: hypothetical protein MJA83_05830 [Gammaproteobacteria bacterium]|nr:hypothetical protein [Gammaproteobacteria bacterium]
MMPGQQRISRTYLESLAKKLGDELGKTLYATRRGGAWSIEELCGDRKVRLIRSFPGHYTAKEMATFMEGAIWGAANMRLKDASPNRKKARR